MYTLVFLGSQAQVLAGRSIKDVAQETGVPAPSLHQPACKVREHLKPLESAVLSIQVKLRVQPRPTMPPSSTY